MNKSLLCLSASILLASAGISYSIYASNQVEEVLESEPEVSWQQLAIESPRLAKIAASWIGDHSAALPPPQQRAFLLLADAMKNDVEQALLFSALEQYGYSASVKPIVGGFVVQNRWRLDAEDGSQFAKGFPVGAAMLFNGETLEIPACSEGSVPILLSGELYPLKSKPLGVSVEQRNDQWEISIDGDTNYSHRALIDIGCVIEKT